jgi:hypothetical protein
VKISGHSHNRSIENSKSDPGMAALALLISSGRADSEGASPAPLHRRQGPRRKLLVG